MTTTGEWSTGLCDCFDDCSSCCLALCCPCCSFGRIAAVVSKGNTSCGVSGTVYSLLCLLGCECCYSCVYRSKLRNQYKLAEEPCNDCCVHWCCRPCALSQEYRELKNRGCNPSMGWQGYQDKQVGMAPIGPGEMKR